MSKKINFILLSVLVLQAILITVLYAPDSKNIQSEINFLKGLSKEATISFHISSSEGEKIHLIKNNQGPWFISNENITYPGDSEHIEDVISRLIALKSSHLVTQTVSSHPRLKVADEVYERKIVLTDKNEKKHTIYLGSSTAPKTIHVRLQDSNEVYLAKGLSSWELNADADLWWDRRYVDEEIELLQSIELTNSHGSFSLLKSESGWYLEGDKTTKLSPGELNEFLHGVSLISLTNYLGHEDVGYGFEKPIAVLTLTGRQGPLTLKVAAKPEEESRFVAKSSESPHYVKVTEFAIDTLLNTRKEQLINKEK